MSLRRTRRSRLQLELSGLAALFAVALAPDAAGITWPVGGGVTPAINTSFGPRINWSTWDFHDGIDVPAPLGTPVVAVADAVVHREGPGGTDGYSSRHVVLRFDHPTDGTLYAVYLHLDTIDPAVMEGGTVTDGQVIGTLGDDGATYPHLHFEIRRGSWREIASVHPLHYLPYVDSPNFTAPVLDRIGVTSGSTTVRLTFSASDKDEGDLLRAEVDLLAGGTLLESRIVDFDDKTTIQEGRGDHLAWTDDVAVEGYQRSDMVAAGRTDIQYGILVRKLPPGCDAVRARVVDVAGNVAQGALEPVVHPSAGWAFADFDDLALPPIGWNDVTSTSGTGTTLAVSAGAGRSGSGGLTCIDSSATETGVQVAAVTTGFDPLRLQWVAEGWFRPDVLTLAASDNVYPLSFFAGGPSLVAAATIRNDAGTLRAGVVVKNADGSIRSTLAPDVIVPGEWRRWVLAIQRLGTRECTVALQLDGVEAVRRQWIGTAEDAEVLRAGIGLSSRGASAIVVADDVSLVEGGLLDLPSQAPGANADLRLSVLAGDLSLTWGPPCSPMAIDHAVYQGSLGDFASRAPVLCSTAGATSATLPLPAGDAYFLAVPLSASREGSAGRDSNGGERPPAGAPCCPPLIGGCSP